MNVQTALVLLGHGARDPAWAGPMERARVLLTARRPATAIELAFLEFMQPTLDEAIDALVQGGHKAVVVVPFFLAHGTHLKKDVPLLLDGARARHPGCAITLAPAVGEADTVLAAMADYAAACGDGVIPASAP